MRTLNSSEQTYSPPKSHSGHILAVCSLNKGNSHIYFTFPQTYFLGNTTSLKTHPKCPTPSPTSVQTFQKRSGDETTQNVFSIYSATILEGVWVHVSWVYSRPPLFHTVPPPPSPPSLLPPFIPNSGPPLFDPYSALPPPSPFYSKPIPNPGNGEFSITLNSILTWNASTNLRRIGNMVFGWDCLGFSPKYCTTSENASWRIAWQYLTWWTFGFRQLIQLILGFYSQST